MWLAGEHQRGLAPSTIDGYLNGLNSAHVDFGLPRVFHDNPQIARILKGIENTYGSPNVRPPRLPITVDIVTRFMHLFNDDCGEHRLTRAAIWVAVTTLLRPGELGAITTKAHRFPRVSDISVAATSPPSVVITLRESKTDRRRRGAPITLYSDRAVHELVAYMKRRSAPLNPESPLFAHADGSPLLHRQLMDRTKALVVAAGIPFVAPDGKQCEGISFRKGGTSTLAEAGVPEDIIQEIGRWKSYTNRLYTHRSVQAKTAIVSAAFNGAK
jgi:hypothetical protein